MALREKKKNKEEARLFFEYLRESEKYKDLCDLMRQGKKLIELPKKFQPATGPIEVLNPLVFTYLRLGDVHIMDFEAWYDDKINTAVWNGYTKAHIKDGPSAISNDLDCCLNIFRDREGREPTGQELKTELLLWIERGLPFRSYIQIYRNRFTATEASFLGKEFHDILVKDIKKESSAHKLDLFLEIYRIMKKKSVNDAVRLAEKYSPEKEIYEESEVYRFNRYAKKIIKNAEHGIFPGQYR